MKTFGKNRIFRFYPQHAVKKRIFEHFIKWENCWPMHETMRLLACARVCLHLCICVQCHWQFHSTIQRTAFLERLLRVFCVLHSNRSCTLNTNTIWLQVNKFHCKVNQKNIRFCQNAWSSRFHRLIFRRSGKSCRNFLSPTQMLCITSTCSQSLSVLKLII